MITRQMVFLSHLFDISKKADQDRSFSHQKIFTRTDASMSYPSFVWICLFAIVLIPIVDARSIATLSSGTNGGGDCAACSIVLGLVDKLTIVHNKSVEDTLELLCQLLPAPYKSFCKVAVEFLGK